MNIIKQIKDLEQEILEIKEQIVNMELAGYEDNESQKLFRKLQKSKMLKKAKLETLKEFQKEIEEIYQRYKTIEIQLRCSKEECFYYRNHYPLGKMQDDFGMYLEYCYVCGYKLHSEEIIIYDYTKIGEELKSLLEEK